MLNQVIFVLNLDMKPTELSNMITTENPENTRILTISVESAIPDEAQAIANAMREAASVTIQDIMEIDAANTIEEANLPESSPSSPSTLKNTVIGGALEIVLAAGIVVLIFLLDDTIKNPDDVENYLGFNVLTLIPIQEGEPEAKRTKRWTTRKMAREMEQ